MGKTLEGEQEMPGWRVVKKKTPLGVGVVSVWCFQGHNDKSLFMEVNKDLLEYNNVQRQHKLGVRVGDIK